MTKDVLYDIETNTRMVRLKIYKYCILVVMILFCLAPVFLFAVMPPEHYERHTLQSKIKAIAVVEKIKVLETTRRSTHKEIHFRRIRAITPDTPEKFTGKCYSTDHPWQEPGAGGMIYFYPEKGGRVFVTVSSEGGSITSYTILSPELEKAIIKNPAGVRFRMGEVFMVDEK